MNTDGKLNYSLNAWLPAKAGIKQHLKIKSFWGQSENAVKTQVWIAVSVYVLVAIAKKKFMLQQSLYEILQILSISILKEGP